MDMLTKKHLCDVSNIIWMQYAKLICDEDTHSFLDLCVLENYSAYEIDKYAQAVSQKNYPEIKHCGDVFEGDYTKHKNCDLLMGGIQFLFKYQVCDVFFINIVFQTERLHKTADFCAVFKVLSLLFGLLPLVFVIIGRFFMPSMSMSLYD